MQRFLFFNMFLFLFTFNSRGQINLVNNPSFEDTVSCPDGPGQINRAIGWNTLITGGGGNPELYHTCCSTNCGVPYNHGNTGYQYPKSGNAYAGIDAIRNNGTWREYIQSKLQDKLKSGDSYCVKFYTNLSNYSAAYIEPLGAYLDNGEILTNVTFGIAYANTFLQPVSPQVYNTNQPLNDTLNWMKIEGSFVAIGLEEYITIGNFFSDSVSSIGVFGTPTNWFAYYYIDDISVINANLLAFAGNDTIIQPGDSVFIGRQSEIGLDEDCIWYVNGLPIDTIAGMWVKPDSTTTYILEQTICGNVSYDTVMVSVYGTSIESYTKDGKGITLYPNPATNTLNIESSTKFSQLLISDILGNVVIRQQVYNKAVSVDVSGLGKGLYFVKLVGEKGFVVKRFLKE